MKRSIVKKEPNSYELYTSNKSSVILERWSFSFAAVLLAEEYLAEAILLFCNACLPTELILRGMIGGSAITLFSSESSFLPLFLPLFLPPFPKEEEETRVSLEEEGYLSYPNNNYTQRCISFSWSIDVSHKRV